MVVRHTSFAIQSAVYSLLSPLLAYNIACENQIVLPPRSSPSLGSAARAADASSALFSYIEKDPPSRVISK